MRVLITGAAGFVGRHLASYLVSLGGHEIWGLARLGDPTDGLEPGLRLLSVDLMDREQVRCALEKVRPEAVYHLAAQSSVARSLEDPLSTLTNNIGGQVNLLEAIRELALNARILVVGSSDEYGLNQPDELPVVETRELRPITAYAVSKVTQDLLGLQYFATHNLQIVRVRPSVHTGPGQSPSFVIPAFARQIAEIEAGLREPVMRVGYLQGKRDFTDVRDVVRGYRLALHKGGAGEVYNLGCEQPRSIESALHGLIAASSVRPRVETDPALLRPLDIPVQHSDCSKLRAATGWRAEIPFDQTLADVLDYWRLALSSRSS